MNIFKFGEGKDEKDVRTVVVDGAIKFVLTDIAKAIGYRDAAKFSLLINEKYKGTGKTGTLGGEQEVILVTEPGLYQGLARSNQPKAQPFQDWLFEEVLPSIRRTGGYQDPLREIERAEIEWAIWREFRMKTAREFYSLVDAVRSISTPENYLFMIKRECNLLNIIVVGQTSADFKHKNKVTCVRDALNAEQLALMDKVQEATITLIIGGRHTFGGRQETLTRMFPRERSLALMPGHLALGVWRGKFGH